RRRPAPPGVGGERPGAHGKGRACANLLARLHGPGRARKVDSGQALGLGAALRPPGRIAGRRVTIRRVPGVSRFSRPGTFPPGNLPRLCRAFIVASATMSYKKRPNSSSADKKSTKVPL